jgi:LacI family transcriptional regulator
LTTIRDVANYAGVSIATVSRVINQNGYVNKETELKVARAMQELKYRPSSLARGLAGIKMNTIALILPDISNPFFPELARAVEDAAQQNEYNLFLCNTYDLVNKEKAYIEIMKRKHIDGIIIVSSNFDENELDQLHKSKIPIVLLDRSIQHPGCTVIRSKNYEGSKLAVEHLLEIGCRKIAHVSGPEELSISKERLAGYLETVKDMYWYQPTLIEHGNFIIEGGRKAVRTLIERHPDIDGIFVGNDLMALGALKELLQMKIKVPEEIAICGFDGIAMTEITEPELTTVAQPIYEMGVFATETLIKKIKGDIVNNCMFELDVKLIKRKSTMRNLLNKSS